ncbi:hypothetical protein BC940DRAFT_349652 [Gongronella butleri]|nr:hypothetical protein BC940DRAFT_349652 [Gongronella butleri]
MISKNRFGTPLTLFFFIYEMNNKSFSQQRAILRPTKHAAFFADDDDDDDDDYDDLSFHEASSMSSAKADTLMLAQFLSSTSPDQFNKTASLNKKQRASRLFNRLKKKSPQLLPLLQKELSPALKANSVRSIASADKKRHIPLPVYTPPPPPSSSLMKKARSAATTMPMGGNNAYQTQQQQQQHQQQQQPQLQPLPLQTPQQQQQARYRARMDAHDASSLEKQQAAPMMTRPNVASSMVARSQSHAPPTTSSLSKATASPAAKAVLRSSPSHHHGVHVRASAVVRSASTTSSRLPLRDSGVYSDTSMDKDVDWIPPVPAKSQHRPRRSPSDHHNLTPSSSTSAHSVHTTSSVADRRRQSHHSTNNPHPSSSSRRRTIRHVQVQTDDVENDKLNSQIVMNCPRCHHHMKVEPINDEKHPKTMSSASSLQSIPMTQGRRTSCPAFLPTGNRLIDEQQKKLEKQHDKDEHQRLLSMIEELKVQLAEEQASRHQLEIAIKRQQTASEKRDMVAREVDRWKEDVHWLNDRLSTLPAPRN